MPELVGTSGSLRGLHFDVVDVGAKLHAGQTPARMISIATVPSNFVSQGGAGHRLWLAIGVLSAALTRRRKRDA